jgi:hypothetical protein
LFAGGTEAVVNLPGFAGSTRYSLFPSQRQPRDCFETFRQNVSDSCRRGSGVLCLEELEHAMTPGEDFAELKFGFSCDASIS